MGNDSRISTKIIFLKIKINTIHKKTTAIRWFFFINKIVGLRLLNLHLFHIHSHNHSYTCTYSYIGIYSCNDNHNHN